MGVKVKEYLRKVDKVFSSPFYLIIPINSVIIAILYLDVKSITNLLNLNCYWFCVIVMFQIVLHIFLHTLIWYIHYYPYFWLYFV